MLRKDLFWSPCCITEKRSCLCWSQITDRRRQHVPLHSCARWSREPPRPNTHRIPAEFTARLRPLLRMSANVYWGTSCYLAVLPSYLTIGGYQLESMKPGIHVCVTEFLSRLSVSHIACNALPQFEKKKKTHLFYGRYFWQPVHNISWMTLRCICSSFCITTNLRARP